MQEYHYAWLSIHPSRTKEWLKQQLLDGFDVHHADGDRSNNNPHNLVLIENQDHMRLHKLPLMRRLDHWHKQRSSKVENMRRFGALCYDGKNSSVSWREIGAGLNPESKSPQQWALLTAKAYAEANSLPFPKPNSSMPKKGKVAV